MSTSKRNVIRRITPLTQPVRSPAIPAPSAQPSSLTCPSCFRVNPPGEVYCYGCGTLLVSAGSTHRIAGASSVDDNEATDAYFGDGMALYLQVRGVEKMIRVVPCTSEMVIGRHTPDGVMFPDVDLAPYQGEKNGVSRLHAGLRRHENTLVLSDMGSLNHTYINGQRLHSHEVRVIHHGDELRFGQLVVRVFFRKESDK
jgi:hypothetical protein